MLGGEVVEGEQLLAILDQAGHGLVVLGRVGIDEGVEGRLRRLAGLGHPDRVQLLLGLGLQALGQLVQHVGRLVNPAALRARGTVNLAQRLLEPEIAVADGELRAELETAVPEIDEQLMP